MTVALHAYPGRPLPGGTSRFVAWGTVLTGLPLLMGPVMAAVMLSGRLEDPSNAFGALWAAPVVAFPAALAGAIFLAIGLRHDRAVLHTVLALTGLALVGVAGGVMVPEMTGLDGESSWSPAFTMVFQGATGGFVLLYAVCLLALTVVGLRRLTRHRPGTPRHAALP